MPKYSYMHPGQYEVLPQQKKKTNKQGARRGRPIVERTKNFALAVKVVERQSGGRAWKSSDVLEVYLAISGDGEVVEDLALQNPRLASVLIAGLGHQLRAYLAEKDGNGERIFVCWRQPGSNARLHRRLVVTKAKELMQKADDQQELVNANQTEVLRYRALASVLAKYGDDATLDMVRDALARDADGDNRILIAE